MTRPIKDIQAALANILSDAITELAQARAHIEKLGGALEGLTDYCYAWHLCDGCPVCTAKAALHDTAPEKEPNQSQEVVLSWEERVHENYNIEALLAEFDSLVDPKVLDALKRHTRRDTILKSWGGKDELSQSVLATAKNKNRP